MAYFAKNTQDDLDETDAELLPAIRQSSDPQIVFPQDGDAAPTRADLPYGYAGRYLPTQGGGYLGQVLTPDQISYLMGPKPLPTPRPLVKLYNFFTHIAQSPFAPGAGVLAMAGLSVWVHGVTDHQWWGGGIIAAGVLLIRSGIHAHKKHGNDADAMFTKGAALAGIATIGLGTGVTAGLSRWEGLAVGAMTVVVYVARGALKRWDLGQVRGFAVGLVASGNTGPALSWNPPPNAWNGPVSDEEYRLRKAFTEIKGERVIVGAVQRLGESGTWYVYVDLSDTGLTAAEVEQKAVKIATVMGARLVEIEPQPRPSSIKVTVYDGEDTLAETIPWDGGTVASALDPIPLGPFEDGSQATISLAWKHTLVCGTTDMGKSGVLNLVLCKTMPAQNLVRILIDCKEGGPEFRAYRDVAFHVATDLEDAMRTLAGIEGIYRYRGRLLVEKDVPREKDEAGETVQKWREEFGPFILCSIDELTELTSNVKGAAERIQSLRRVMRFVGLFALDATQFPDRNTFGGTATARMNYLNRVSLAIAEQGGTNIIFGQGMHGRGWRPDLLDAPGKFLIYTPMNKRPRKARAERVESPDVAQVVAHWHGRVPDLDEGSKEAFWEAYHAEPEMTADGDGGGGPRGGKRQEQQDEPVAYGRPHLVVVPTYPNGLEIAEEDVALWQLLGEYGRGGAPVSRLAAQAKARGHRFNSPPWVRNRLKVWVEMELVDWSKDGREEVFWRRDLRSEAVRDGAAS